MTTSTPPEDPRLVEAREALAVIRRSIFADINALSICCTVWVNEADSPNETLVDYIDATLDRTK